jgi:ABC-type transport system substrate-binding protein
MTYTTVIPTPAQIERFENDLKYISVENLDPEAVKGYSQQLKEEIVADTIAFATAFKNGTLQVCDGTPSEIIAEIIEENNKARNVLKTIKSSKIKPRKHRKIYS